MLRGFDLMQSRALDEYIEQKLAERLAAFEAVWLRNLETADDNVTRLSLRVTALEQTKGRR